MSLLQRITSNPSAINTPVQMVAAQLTQRSSAVITTTQTRNMSKYLSKSATKRLPLHPKHAKKGFYKGNGCRSEGRHTSKARFIMDRSKMLELVVPDLTGFPVCIH